jgi:hypothetical protein
VLVTGLGKSHARRSGGHVLLRMQDRATVGMMGT